MYVFSYITLKKNLKSLCDSFWNAFIRYFFQQYKEHYSKRSYCKQLLPDLKRNELSSNLAWKMASHSLGFEFFSPSLHFLEDFRTYNAKNYQVSKIQLFRSIVSLGWKSEVFWVINDIYDSGKIMEMWKCEWNNFFFRSIGGIIIQRQRFKIVI